MPRWTFVRHGLTRESLLGLLNGWYDSSLLPQGRMQACAAGAVLSTQSYQRILSSDLGRARETALLLAEQAGFPSQRSRPEVWDFSPELRERRMGAWQGCLLQELRKSGQSARLISWADAPPGGESLRDLARRLLDYLAEQPPEATLVVSHAGPMRVLLGLLDGKVLDELGKMKIKMACPYHREVPARRWEELRDQLQ